MMSRLKVSLSFVLVMLAIVVAFPAMALAEPIAPDGTTSTSMPTIHSDLADYPPGATVTLTGSNWQPDESVHVNVNDTYGATWSRNVDISANASGNITDSFNLPDYFVSDYDVTATGAQSGTVRTTFTDAAPASVLVSPTTQSVTQGGSTPAYAVNVGMAGNSTACTITLSAVGLPSGATASFTNNPNTTATNYTSNLTVNTTNATAAGTYTFRVDASKPDGCNGAATVTSSATLTLVVNSANTAPVANNDSATTSEDNAINSINALANDTDAQGNTLSVSSFTQPSNGTVAKNADNTFKYVPNANYNGTDTFTYKANDGTVDSSNSATVTITINSVNNVPSFTKGADQTKNEDAGAQTVTGWASAISSGPSNESGQTVDFIVSNNNNSLFTTGGQPAVSASGTLTYTSAPDANGTATVSVKIHDDGGTANGGVDTSAVQTFTITISPVNDAPVANNDSATTNEDMAKDIAVLANDTDVDNTNAQLSVSSYTQPSHGTVSQNADGTLKYNPAANYNGSDSFTYKAKDASLDSNTVTVSLTVNAVNDAPVADDQSVSTDEDTSKDVTLSASDVENDALTYEIVAGPSHGTLSGTGATRTYTPAADYNGPDSFTYKANDGNLDSNVATVRITVTAVNDAPVGTGDSYTSIEDTDLTVSAANGLLKNDTDIDNDQLHVDDADATATGINPVSGPSHGTLTLNADGSFTYKPNLDYSGTNSFTYEVCDQGDPALCATATVRISVSPMPDTCTIRGTSKNDLLRGTAHRDVICAFGGDDVIQAMGGNDLVLGGGGKDTIQGGTGDDTLKGGNGNDTIQGQEGNDRLYGGFGNDTLQGGAGRDVIRGGPGKDVTQQ